MKRKMFLIGTLALMVAGGIFWSCQKDDLVPNPDGLDLKNATVNFLGISADPVPAIVGEDLTITGTTSRDCGQWKIVQKIEDVWTDLTDFIPASSTVPITATIIPDVAGVTLEFRIQYNPGSDANCNSGRGGFSTTLSVPVQDSECSTNLSITANLTSVNDNGDGTYTFTASYVVKACVALVGVKTQGGLTAGCTEIQTDGTIKTVNKNKVVNWIDDFYAGQTRIYTVTFTQKIKGCGITYVTGAWSAKAMYEGVELVAGYDNKLYLEIPCD